MLVSSFTMAYVMAGKMAFIFLVSVPILAISLILIIKNTMPLFKKVFKKYDRLNESIEENGNSSPHSREEILAIYRDSLNASIALFNKSACAMRLQKLNKLRNKDVGHISINEREELYEALDENFITVITYLRDEANKHSQTKLSPLNIHLILLLAMGYSTGVIRECLAVSADNAVTQQKKRVLSRLPDDILHMLFDY